MLVGLAARLKRLAESGIVTSSHYTEHPPRLEYSLTEKGEGLRPVIRAMVEWDVRYAGVAGHHGCVRKNAAHGLRGTDVVCCRYKHTYRGTLMHRTAASIVLSDEEEQDTLTMGLEQSDVMPLCFAKIL